MARLVYVQFEKSRKIKLINIDLPGNVRRAIARANHRRASAGSAGRGSGLCVSRYVAATKGIKELS